MFDILDRMRESREIIELMLWSRLFIPTLRANPAGEPLSRQLLQRAGFLRGADRWLPLARRSLRRIVAIVRDEMDAAGGQEMLLPDSAAFESVAREIRSYKQLPQVWYRFSAEMEARRFSLEPAPLNAICGRILDRCGVAYAVTERSLVVYAEEGGDSIAACAACGYASPMESAEAASAKPAVEDPAGNLAPEPFHTPGRKTIAQVAEFVGLPESSQMKSLVLVANGAPALVMLRGDHQLSDAKFAAATGDADFRTARPDELFEWFGAGAGSLGPVGVKNMPILMDRALAGRRNMIAGANRDDYHLRNVTQDEDFHAAAHDLRQVVAGDGCIRCGAAIEERKAIELAHFDPARGMPDLHVTNAAAQEVQLSMSACRIAIERILPAVALTIHDSDGLILPRAMAPFDVIVTPAKYADAAQREAAHAIYSDCGTLGLDTLLDDRDERPGVKFKDADLIGVPYRITVGKKLVEGLVEIVERKTKQTKTMAAAEAAAAVHSAVTSEV
jgi:prolyl-tRNA synthetase